MLICSAPGKSGSLGKEVLAATWKFEFGTQQVKVLSRERLANEREASLAQCWGDPRCEA